jgi:transposase
MKKELNKRKKRTQRDYSLGFKLAVVNCVEKGDLTYKQCQRHYGIQGRSTVLVWLRKHGTLDWTSKPKSPTMGKHAKKETPAQHIKRLEPQLKDEKDKNLILTTMIDLAEQEYGASLRKKYYPWPSSDSNKDEQ